MNIGDMIDGAVQGVTHKLIEEMAARAYQEVVPKLKSDITAMMGPWLEEGKEDIVEKVATAAKRCVDTTVKKYAAKETEGACKEVGETASRGLKRIQKAAAIFADIERAAKEDLSRERVKSLKEIRTATTKAKKVMDEPHTAAIEETRKELESMARRFAEWAKKRKEEAHREVAAATQAIVKDVSAYALDEACEKIDHAVTSFVKSSAVTKLMKNHIQAEFAQRDSEREAGMTLRIEKAVSDALYKKAVAGGKGL